MRRWTPWAAIAASAAVNLPLFFVLAWAQTPARALPKPEAYAVREIFQAAPPPPEPLETPETPVVAETPAALPEPAPLEPAPPAERFDARLELPALDLPLPGPPVPSNGEPIADAGPSGALDVGLVDRPPRRAVAPLPPYPSWARIRRLEAVVTLRLIVGADGRVRDAEVERVEGDPRFGEVARDAVRAWTFEPAVRGGRPVDCILIQRVRFDLVDQ